MTLHNAQQSERRTITIEAACEKIGIGRSKGYNLARRNQFPGLIVIGKRYLVSVAALDRYLDGLS